MEAFIGSIILFAGNFAPRGWAFCNGQIMSIAQNTALFSILGTTYGGNGTTTFALPDLRGRVPVSSGQGPGLSNWQLGEVQGSESVTLLQNEMPAHNHTQMATNAPGSSSTPSGVLATFGTDIPPAGPYSSSNPNTTLAANAIGVSGGSQPHNNIQPTLALNYIICMEGIFPSRG